MEEQLVTESLGTPARNTTKQKRFRNITLPTFLPLRRRGKGWLKQGVPRNSEPTY